MLPDRSELVEAFVAAGYATKTARVYTTAVAAAAAALALDGRGLDDAPATAVRDYAETLPHTRSSRALLRSALGAYWAMTERPSPPLGAIRVPTKPRMVCRALSEPQAAVLAREAEARRDRKGLAVLLALYAGLRRSEIAAARWSDVTGDGWLRVVGKGDVTAELPLHPVLVEAVDRLRDGDGWIFPGRFGGPLNPTTLWGWVRQVSRDAGLGDVPTHVLRHTCLATALDTTHDLRSVQELARHASPDTTAGYTRVTRRRLAEVVTAIDYQEAS